MKRVLIIAAHPDDEILGCGGTMARLNDEGIAVHIQIMAEGLTSRSESRAEGLKSAALTNLTECAHNAAKVVGATSCELLGFPDNRLDSVDFLDLVKAIELKIDAIKPDTIFTHSASDLNIDHTLIHKAVITATRPIPGNVVQTVYTFEIPSSTEWNFGASTSGFLPNFFVTLSKNQLAKKMQALQLYTSEMREFPHPRSLHTVKLLAQLRGSSIGFEAAEAFNICRMIY